jgi:hypothetical protein
MARSAGVEDPKATGSAGSRSTTRIGGQAHCQTLMPGVREKWIGPRLPSTATRPRCGDARPVHAVRAQHIGEDGDRVVALEGDEGERVGQPLTEGCLDPGTERSWALGEVAQERERGAVGAQRRRPFDELRLPGRSADHGLGEALVVADRPDDRHRRLRRMRLGDELFRRVWPDAPIVAP